MKKSRIRNLSTRYLELYRYGSLLIATVFIAAIIYFTVDDFSSTDLFRILYFASFWGIVIYKWLQAHVKVFKVEFDDDFIYIIKRNQDIMIPLENIKNIEMKSLGGMWRVDLLYTDVIGDHFYFKPSLLYPLNYKTKDELVNLLWQKIEIAKTKKPYFPVNALQS